MRHQRALLVLSLLLVVACGGPASPAGPTPDGEWILVEGHGPDGPIPLVETHPVTLAVDGDTIGGTAACNSYGGQAVIDGRQLTLREISQTEMACGGQDVMASEAAYVQALLQVREHGRDADRLVLEGEETRLVFAPAEDEATDADDVEGDEGADVLDPDTPVSDEPLPEPDEPARD